MTLKQQTLEKLNKIFTSLTHEEYENEYELVLKIHNRERLLKIHYKVLLAKYSFDYRNKLQGVLKYYAIKLINGETSYFNEYISKGDNPDTIRLLLNNILSKNDIYFDNIFSEYNKVLPPHKWASPVYKLSEYNNRKFTIDEIINS